jgi:adenosylcobinamide-phosphate synthase
MVGSRSPLYLRFGWASARLDDLLNLVPARLTALLVAAVAPVVGGTSRGALRVAVRDGHRHPSPNSGYGEAAYAGAFGLRLGGRNVYEGRVEERPGLGDGRPPAVGDLGRAARLCAAVTAAAAVGAALGAGLGAGRGARRRTRR